MDINEDMDELSSISWKLKNEEQIETSAKVWTIAETEKFLQLYEKLIENGSYTRKKFLWVDVANNMKNNNFEVTARQCENKWKGLTRAVRFGKKHVFSDRIRELSFLDPLENNDTPSKWEFDKSVNNEREDLYRFSLQEHDYFPNAMNNSKTWSRFETERLIEHYKAVYQSADVPKIKKDMWEKISQNMQLEKINVTAYQCENKWKGLLRAYKNSQRTTRYEGKATLYEKLEDALTFSENSIHNKSEKCLPYKKFIKPNITIAEYEDEDDDEDDDVDDDDDEEEEDEDDEIITNVINTNPNIKTEPDSGKFYFSDIQTNLEEIVETSQSPKLEAFPKLETESFESKFLDYLYKKEKARQKRHDENMQIKRRKLHIMEILLTKKKRIMK